MRGQGIQETAIEFTRVVVYMGGKETRSDLSKKNCSLIIRVAWVTFCYMWGHWGTQGMPRQRRILGGDDRVQESALGMRRYCPMGLSYVL